MTWSPDSSTTGGAQTGFTTPTFTLVSTVAPAVNAVSKAVSAVSGTATATANSASSPFTVSFWVPLVYKALSSVWNSVKGLFGTVPNNQYKIIFRKGGLAAAGVPVTAVARITFDIPAGMETYNPDEVRALVSFMVGILNEESADVADTLVTGVL